ncbi:MAG: hypothetical protein H6721_03800 [Sandaracinus sp.]|nr:hypothetical protein [Sandaracinus sp.]
MLRRRHGSSPVDADLRAPESAHWDATRGVWFVSSFGQAFDLSGATDSPAYVSRLAADGTVLDERLVELDGDLLGLAVLDGTLYASHGSELLAIDVDTRSVTPIAIPDAAFLNDVAAGRGAVYVSDTGNGRILRYVPGGAVEVVATDLAALNGLLVEDDGLVVVTLGAFPPDASQPGAIFRVADDGTTTRLGSLSGAFDGIEADGDAYLVTEFGGVLWRVARDGSAERVSSTPPPKA